METMHCENIVADLSFSKLKSHHQQHPCKGCQYGKQSKSSYPTNPEKQRLSVPGSFIHGDLSGKFSTPSLPGSQYYILYKDDATAFWFVSFSKTKDAALPFFKQVVKWIKCDTGNNVIKFRSDRGTEFCNKDFENFLQDAAITHDTSTVYTPQQNGYIERDNRTIMEMTRSLIHAKDLPKRLWAEAVHTAVYLLNRTINTQLGNNTPYERFFKQKPLVSHYRVFGALAYVFVNKQQRTKLDPKSFKGYFVGYSNTSKAYRFWNPSTDKIVESADYCLDEYNGKYLAGYPPDPGISSTNSIEVFFDNDDFDDSFTAKELARANPSRPDVISSPLESVGETSTSSSTSSGSISTSIESNDLIQPRQKEPRFKTYIELLRNTIKMLDYPSQILSNAYLATIGKNIYKPQTLQEARLSLDSHHWHAAMKRELTALQENNTWRLVSLLSDRKAVRNKWVFKIKYKANDEIEKYKARLV
jgi:hypothetical protein